MVTDSLGMRINYLLGEQYKYKFQTALPTSQPGGAPVKLLSCIDEDREISAVPNSAGYMRSSNDWPAKKIVSEYKHPFNQKRLKSINQISISSININGTISNGIVDFVDFCFGRQQRTVKLGETFCSPSFICER